MYTAKNYEHLLGTPGFSDTLLKNHFGLYEGYVKNVNLLSERLRDGITGPEAAELRRRFGWEWNGMRLHEYYFENLTKNPPSTDKAGEIVQTIQNTFGSLTAWEKDFRGTGTMRGIGWTMLVHDRSSKKLFNIWVTEHDMGHLAGAEILLVLDVFEHAYVLDYGMKRADYIDAFMRAIDWSHVGKRFIQ